jgi:hypothetical protein
VSNDDLIEVPFKYPLHRRAHAIVGSRRNGLASRSPRYQYRAFETSH